MSATDTVIITPKHRADAYRYHTDVCRKVWAITSKRYVAEAEARRRGYEECAYCSGEYENSSGDDSIYRAARKIGRERAGAD